MSALSMVTQALTQPGGGLTRIILHLAAAALANLLQ